MLLVGKAIQEGNQEGNQELVGGQSAKPSEGADASY
jgi:hypothetical protein